MGAVLVTLAQGLPASFSGAFALSSPFSLFQAPDGVFPFSSFQHFSSFHPSGADFLVNFSLNCLLTREVRFFRWIFSVLGTVFLHSLFARKDATFSTGEFYSVFGELNLTQNLPVQVLYADILRQDFYQLV